MKKVIEKLQRKYVVWPLFAFVNDLLYLAPFHWPQPLSSLSINYQTVFLAFRSLPQLINFTIRHFRMPGNVLKYYHTRFLTLMYSKLISFPFSISTKALFVESKCESTLIKNDFCSAFLIVKKASAA